MRGMMRAGLAVMLVLTVPAAAKTQAADANTAELAAFADRFDQAQLSQDGAALERMVSDDLVFIASNGKRMGKAEFIAGWTDPDTRFGPAPTEERVVMPLGPDAGIVGGAATLTGTTRGAPFSTRIRFADTFRRVNGEWRAVHVQATKIP